MNLTRLNPLNLAEKLTGRPIGAGTRHFFKDSFFFTAAGIIPRFLGLLITPVTTYYLTTAEYNTFGVFMNSVILIVCMVMSVQAENSVARYYYENKNDFPDFLGTLFIFTGVLAALMFVQFWIFRDTWSWVFGVGRQRDRLGMTIFLWGLCCAAPQILHQVYLQLLMAQRRSRAYFGWNLAKNLIYVVFGVLFLVAVPTSRVFGLIWAYSIATFALAVPFLVALVRRMRLVFHWKHIRYALHFSLPGLPGAISLFLINFFDKLFFQHTKPDIGGMYAFAYTIGWLVQMMTQGLFQAYMPRFYANMNAERGEVNQPLFTRNFKLLLAGAFCLTVMSQPMALLLGRNPDYHKGLPIVPIIICSYLFMYLGQCYGLYIAFRRRHIALQSLSQVIAAGLTVGLIVWIWQTPALLAEPLTLMRVVALATLIPFLVQWLIVLFIARVLLKEKTVNFKGIVVPFAVFLAFSVFWSFFGYSGWQVFLEKIRALAHGSF